MPNENFIDYYEDLQVSPNADLETINRVYRLLARKWHPDNAATGDNEKFNIINEAYRVLSNPEKRAAYDAGYENRQNKKWQVLSGDDEESRHVVNDATVRFSILSVLYEARRQDAEKPDIGMWRLSQMLGWPENEMNFHIWYLKEKNWIERTDTGGFAITVIGAEEIESHKTGLRKDRLLTEKTESNEK